MSTKVQPVNELVPESQDCVVLQVIVALVAPADVPSTVEPVLHVTLTVEPTVVLLIVPTLVTVLGHQFAIAEQFTAPLLESTHSPPLGLSATQTALVLLGW